MCSVRALPFVWYLTSLLELSSPDPVFPVETDFVDGQNPATEDGVPLAPVNCPGLSLASSQMFLW